MNVFKGVSVRIILYCLVSHGVSLSFTNKRFHASIIQFGKIPCNWFILKCLFRSGLEVYGIHVIPIQKITLLPTILFCDTVVRLCRVLIPRYVRTHRRTKYNIIWNRMNIRNQRIHICLVLSAQCTVSCQIAYIIPLTN